MAPPRSAGPYVIDYKKEKNKIFHSQGDASKNKEQRVFSQELTEMQIFLREGLWH